MPRTFTITETHMQAFSKQQAQRFESDMVAHVRKNFPNESRGLSDAELREIIQERIKKAESFNIVLEPDVAHYIELTIVLGPDFETEPATDWTQPILLDRQLSGRDKIERIHEQIMFGGGDSAVETNA